MTSTFDPWKSSRQEAIAAGPAAFRRWQHAQDVAALQPAASTEPQGADSSTAWYLAASSSQVDTVELCYLDGPDGPAIESHADFGTDGVSFKCRLDFAAKDIDYRGLYRSAGA